MWESAGVRFARAVVAVYFDRRVGRSAAELAYYFILSFFPVLICINAFLGLLPWDMNMALDVASRFIPQESLPIFADYISYISHNSSSAMLIAGLTMTLFSASAAFRALINIMDDIYGRKSYNGLFKVGASMLYSILFLFTIYLSVTVLLTGSWFFRLIESKFPWVGDLPWAWQWMRFLILFCLVLLFVLLTYRLASPRGEPRPPLLTGGIISSCSLVACSALFSFFIGMTSKYSLVYGSLTSVIILLLWLYLCGNLLIIGSVFNYVLYCGKQKRFREEHLE
jgi:membrane protein